MKHTPKEVVGDFLMFKGGSEGTARCGGQDLPGGGHHYT